MRALGILLHKELLATFGSPIGYTVAAVFLVLKGYRTFSPQPCSRPRSPT